MKSNVPKTEDKKTYFYKLFYVFLISSCYIIVPGITSNK